MNKTLVAAALALTLAAGSASAQQWDYTTPSAASPAGTPLKQRLALLSRENAFGLRTTSAFSRNVGPGSTVEGQAESVLGNANSGLPNTPGAPSAGTVSGGGGQ